MYRFNVSSPERRTHDIFSKEYPKPNLPRFHTLQIKISCTLKINLPMNTLPKQTSLMQIQRATPTGQLLNPSQGGNLTSITNGNRPKGHSGPRHGEEIQSTRLSLLWTKMQRMEWNWKLFAFPWSLLRLWIMSFNCAYTWMLGWINWLDLTCINTNLIQFLNSITSTKMSICDWG